MSQTCPSCGGSGRVNVEACDSCGGKGEIPRHEKLNVKIPPGVDTGSRIRLAGKGNAGQRGGTNGDLYIETKVKSKRGFRRDGQSLFVDISISVPQAILGDSIEVPTIDGKASMKIPQGTQNGQKFRLRGKGLSKMGGAARGDQYVVINVEIPKDIDDDTKEVVRRLADKIKRRG